MNMKQLIHSTALLALTVSFSTASLANPLMTKDQYADYSVKYRCIETRFHDDLAKKESAMIELENSYGLTDDNFDAFDELITEYERDSDLLERILVRAKNECTA